MNRDRLIAMPRTDVELPHPYAERTLHFDLTDEQIVEARRMDSLAASVYSLPQFADGLKRARLDGVLAGVTSRRQMVDRIAVHFGNTTIHGAYLKEAEMKNAAKLEIAQTS